MRAELASVRSNTDNLAAEYETRQKILCQLTSFSQSLAASQARLGDMAQLLCNESHQAVKVADVSVASGQSTNGIVTDLLRLAEDSSASAHEVEVLAKQADQISSIV